VPERSAAELRPGQVVTIETDAYPDERFAAKIDRIGLALDPGTRRIQVRCSVKNIDRKLKPEMFARVSFLADDSGKKGIPLPNTSLFTEGIYSYVFVETQAGTFEKRRVNVKIKGHERSFVNAGLAAGERIVTEGAFLLNAEVAGDAQ
jgi:cobalt-zinc-cadmium efflux system membrane fusion protein